MVGFTDCCRNADFFFLVGLAKRGDASRYKAPQGTFVRVDWQ